MKLNINIMNVSTNKHTVSFQNSLSLLTLLCQGKDKTAFSHFKSLQGQCNAVSTAKCCPTATG
jgi:hypothetical protein